MTLRLLLMLTVVLVFGTADKACGQWKMHTIDNTSRGADGVRLMDVNNDQLQDIVTGWEEGGVIRVYLNPGFKKSTSKWPSVTVGKVKSPEDAVFADLDNDGSVDVISCCEGKTRCVYIHWAPKFDKYLDAAAWKTEAIPCTKDISAWMFAVPEQIDGKNGTDLFVASKNPNGQVSWLQSPNNPRRVNDWKIHKIVEAGWVMSLRSIRFESDARNALIVSDRKGPKRGVYALQRVGSNEDASMKPAWTRHDYFQPKFEFMFLDLNSKPNQTRLAVATRNQKILVGDIQSNGRLSNPTEIQNPLGVSRGKAVAWGDIDLDGKLDLVHTTNTQGLKGKLEGVCWLKSVGNEFSTERISSKRGKKFDRIELLDLDGDGDLDVLTCEESDNLGVIWYENPIR